MAAKLVSKALSLDLVSKDRLIGLLAASVPRCKQSLPDAVLEYPCAPASNLGFRSSSFSVLFSLTLNAVVSAPGHQRQARLCSSDWSWAGLSMATCWRASCCFGRSLENRSFKPRDGRSCAKPLLVMAPVLIKVDAEIRDRWRGSISRKRLEFGSRK